MDQMSLRQRLVDPLQAEVLQRDVTLVCDDRKSLYHQCLLASHSPFLNNLLTERACCSCKSASCGGLTDVVIILDGFKGEVVMNLMQYLYMGECTVKNRRMILDMIELKKGLGIDVQIDFNVNRIKTLKEHNVDTDAATRAGQKRVTLAIMSAIEQVNSGVAKLLCSECDVCLNKDNFMLHYRNHMQTYSQQSSEDQTSRKGRSAIPDHLNEIEKKAKDKCIEEAENFSDFLKKKCATPSFKVETSDIDINKSYEEGMDDDAETVMQSHDDLEPSTNIDMQDYEKLLRSHIHKLIGGRKKAKAKAMKEPENGLILVSQQEIDEEILKNPRNKEEEYGRLKVRQIYRKIYDRKQKLKMKDKTDKEPVVVTDEEIQDEIDKENQTRNVNIKLDVKQIKSTRVKSNINSPLNNAKVPSTPRRNLTTGTMEFKTPSCEPRTVFKRPFDLVDESERKKVYHKIYVRKWNKNQTEGLSSPIQVTEEEILEELASI